MIHRLLAPSKNNSFFIFGARGTGKSFFLSNQFSPKNVLTFDLLDSRIEKRFFANPEILETLIDEHSERIDWVVLDEIQRLPSLLNVVHRLIEKKKIKFCLTGSSARKLKRGAANLLAGRAFIYSLYPFTHTELANKFHLNDVLNWGSLPKIFDFNNDNDRAAYLHSYVMTYLKEEVIAEQLVRKLEPFRLFLPVIGQMSGKVINFSKIAKEVESDTKTIQNYFQILEDTLIGYFLPAFSRSIRKSQRGAPKFYLFDIGVKRALEESLNSKVVQSTSYFGELFEHFIILEVLRLNSYSGQNYKLSYLQTTNGGEIDLILTKGSKNILVEIKSTEKADPIEVSKLSHYKKDFGVNSEAYYVSRDSLAQKIDGVHCIHWEVFFKKLF